MGLKIEEKCTAVEWLVDQIIVRRLLKESGIDVLQLLEDLALEIEKEQIIKAYTEGELAEDMIIRGHDYYQITYGIE